MPADAVREIKQRGLRAATFGFEGLGASIESKSINDEKGARDFLLAKGINAKVAEYKGGKRLAFRDFHAPPVLGEVRQDIEKASSPEKPVDSVSRCDVLSVFFNHFPTWIDTRGNRLGDFLRRNGIEHDFFFTRHETSEQDIEKAIEASKCKVFFNELAVTRPHIIEALAVKFPSVKFVSIYHAAPNYSSDTADWKERTFGALLSSARHSNVFAATVMPADRFNDFKGAQVISLPNFFELPEGIDVPPRGDRPFTLSVVGRRDVVKGTGAAISTLCRLHQERDDIAALLISNQFADAERARIAYEKVNASFVKWGDWQGYLQLIANTVDVGLQYSLTESFNLIALEHLSLGKPVIGSHAIEYLPKAWQINPQDPKAGAVVADKIFDNLEKESEKAKRLASRISRKINKEFLTNLKRLLD